MDIISFHKNYRIPYISESDRQFEIDIEDILSKYIETVKNDFDYSHLSTEVESICTAIIAAIKIYYNGSPKRAYDKIYDCFKQKGKLLNHKIIKTISEIEDGKEFKSLFRGRCDDAAGVISREDMFHMPYSKRTILPTQRYSLPGCPSLYLGGSLYDCWLEMGKPPYHKMYVCRYEVENKDLYILDLAQYPDISNSDVQIMQLLCGLSFLLAQLK